MILSIIAAIGLNNEIGKEGKLLWKLPRDLEHFRNTTYRHTVVMGANTFKSLKRPLPNRRNIVLTTDKNFKYDKVEVVNSLKELQDLLSETCMPYDEVFIIGGAQIYKLFLNVATKFYITYVNGEFPDADTFFPKFNFNHLRKIYKIKFDKNKANEYDIDFVLYKR